MRFSILASLLLVAPAAIVTGHGVPIDVFLNLETDQLYILDNFEPGELQLLAGVDISSDSPSIGVTFESNGVPLDTALQFEVTSGLHYFDGAELADTDATLVIENPFEDSLGNRVESDVIEYFVTQDAEPQAGMTWATYPGGSFWDAHGRFTLQPVSSPAGVYAAAVQISAANHLPTDPFLFPLIYDPDDSLSESAKAAGIELLRNRLFGQAADFDGNGVVDGDDFLAWQSGFGIATGAVLADGDADLDGDVDGDDFLTWQSQFSSGQPAARFTAVPEPAAFPLACLAFAWCLASSKRPLGSFWGVGSFWGSGCVEGRRLSRCASSRRRLRPG